jgi:hypothetical protein
LYRVVTTVPGSAAEPSTLYILNLRIQTFKFYPCILCGELPVQDGLGLLFGQQVDELKQLLSSLPKLHLSKEVRMEIINKHRDS